MGGYGFLSDQRRTYTSAQPSQPSVFSAFAVMACCLPLFRQSLKTTLLLFSWPRLNIDKQLLQQCCLFSHYLCYVHQASSHVGVWSGKSSDSTGMVLDDWFASPITR